jgi:hypothetical protein
MKKVKIYAIVGMVGFLLSALSNRLQAPNFSGGASIGWDILLLFELFGAVEFAYLAFFKKYPKSTFEANAPKISAHPHKGILKKLTDVGYKRNWEEAVVFYLSYLFLSFVVGVLIFIPILMAIPGISTSRSFIGIYFPTIVFATESIVFSLIILAAKKKMGFGWVLFSLAAGGLTFLLSVFFGFSVIWALIIPACLSMLPSSSRPAPIQ